MIQKLKNNLINIPGWKTKRKIVVIESDDWGCIRMSNLENYNLLLKKGYPVDKSPYNKYDSLESNLDLEALFNVLRTVRGIDGKTAKFTINNIVANPNFEKIRKANFQEYFWEPFTTTLNRYPEHDQVMLLYNQGISEGLVKPQFHGREHLNVLRWMNALKNSDVAVLEAFNINIFSPCIAQKTGYINEFMDALDYDSKTTLIDQKKILSDGLDLFQNIWGFTSKSFIAPCYIWDSRLEFILAEKGVKYIQGLINQLNPVDGEGFQYNKKYHYQGQKNKLGQLYLIRNVFFEPTIFPNFFWEEDCINRIDIAFKWNKPAVISSHRLNYIGFLNPENRENNLKRLKFLLETIVRKWPDVQFLSSDELGDLMCNE